MALRRLPPRVQQLGMQLTIRALTPVMNRWPTVLRLLGLAPMEPYSRPHPSRAVARSKRGARTASTSRVDVALATLRSEADVAQRVDAVRALTEARTPAVSVALTSALRDPSAEVAAEAADALRHHAGDSATLALRNVVANSDGYFAGGVRAAAIRTLSVILPHGDGAPITAAVADADAEVSVAAIAGVVDRNEKGGADALFTVLENPRGYYVALTRAAAARGLCALRALPDRTRLQALLQAEHDPEIREILSSLSPAARPD
jgi:HEAT repeat protein